MASTSLRFSSMSTFEMIPIPNRQIRAIIAGITECCCNTKNARATAEAGATIADMGKKRMAEGPAQGDAAREGRHRNAPLRHLRGTSLRQARCKRSGVWTAARPQPLARRSSQIQRRKVRTRKLISFASCLFRLSLLLIVASLGGTYPVVIHEVS